MWCASTISSFCRPVSNTRSRMRGWSIWYFWSSRRLSPTTAKSFDLGCILDRAGLSMTSISDAYDVVVIGAGAGGMTAAAVAAAEGRSVLLVEKTEFVGGTTAWSGGMIWIPVNAKMKQAGIEDSPSAAANYLASTVP